MSIEHNKLPSILNIFEERWKSAGLPSSEIERLRREFYICNNRHPRRIIQKVIETAQQLNGGSNGPESPKKENFSPINTSGEEVIIIENKKSV